MKMNDEQLCFDVYETEGIPTPDKFAYFEEQKNTLNNELTKIASELSNVYGLKYLAFKIESSVLGDGKQENHNHAVSVYIANTFVLRVHLKPNALRVEYRKKLSNYICLHESIQAKEMKSYPDSVIVDLNEKNSVFFDLCSNIMTQALYHYEPSEYFGCCGKYNECSDAKKCLHDDQLYSKACYYRKNLEAGNIFYGKNEEK